jgi:hypothetical protein
MRWFLTLVVLYWLMAGACQAFYNPEQGRWLSRDPLGEKHGAGNLFALEHNDPLSRTDALGLFSIGHPSTCHLCRCKDVRLGPVEDALEVFEAGDNHEHLQFGRPVQFAIETEGVLAPSSCKCTFRDTGHSSATINGTKLEHDFRSFDKPYVEHEIPCVSGTDHPGFMWFDFTPDIFVTIEVSIDISLTVICEGTDGSRAEDTIPLQYNLKFGPFRTPKK